VGCYLGSGKARSVVQAYAETGGHPKDVDRSGIRPEIMGRVLGRDTALHGVRIRLEDQFLSQTDLGQGLPGRDHDLALYDIDTRNLFGNSLRFVCANNLITVSEYKERRPLLRKMENISLSPLTCSTWTLGFTSMK